MVHTLGSLFPVLNYCSSLVAAVGFRNADWREKKPSQLAFFLFSN